MADHHKEKRRGGEMVKRRMMKSINRKVIKEGAKGAKLKPCI
jgi:hypothetical protein